jgi:hypothetical protein
MMITAMVPTAPNQTRIFSGIILVSFTALLFQQNCKGLVTIAIGT